MSVLRLMPMTSLQRLAAIASAMIVVASCSSFGGSDSASTDGGGAPGSDGSVDGFVDAGAVMDSGTGESDANIGDATITDAGLDAPPTGPFCTGDAGAALANEERVFCSDFDLGTGTTGWNVVNTSLDGTEYRSPTESAHFVVSPEAGTNTATLNR